MQHANFHTHQDCDRIAAMPEAGVLEEHILAALSTVAQLLIDDPAFLPVFERLEKELALIKSLQPTVERALGYLPKHS
ncbi:hypothetical protein [uncultured Pelagimonas sp.]|uniref:hypothetical protein n=1 Tax=uncultured Pelagimonas sp. TaxID=1618102 RepID=UPI0026279E36|nr:hypothetical protein [uncultured Pelagimonas sp.]